MKFAVLAVLVGVVTIAAFAHGDHITDELDCFKDAIENILLAWD